jgi:23S rRNA (pseudouridine1915-N3)-methyltransferase
MHIHIVWIGKTKDSYFKQAINEYLKRLKGFCSLEITEILHKQSLPVAQLKLFEAEKIISAQKSDRKYLLLDEIGKQFTSPEFAEMISKSVSLTGKFGLVIGGVYGFSDQLRSQHKCISFSKMTFTHQMVRVILLEQLYRAQTILHNKSYHY